MNVNRCIFLKIQNTLKPNRNIGILRCAVIRNLHRTSRNCQDSTSVRFKNQRETGYALLVVPFATFCLGTWQVRRRQWKKNLIYELESKTTAPPVPFPLDTEELKDLEYRAVTLKGEFDHDKEIYVLPRVPVGEAETPGGGLVGTGPSKSGANVITPFKVADRELTILVNRGWIPRDKLNPKTREEGQIKDEIELSGVVRKTEARKPFAAKNDMARNRWFNRDVEAMAESVGSDAIFIDAVKGSTVPGGPIGGQTRATLRNEHMQYIVTWYSLTALTTFMWAQKYLR